MSAYGWPDLKGGVATWHNLVEWSLVVGGVQLSEN